MKLNKKIGVLLLVIFLFNIGLFSFSSSSPLVEAQETFSTPSTVATVGYGAIEPYLVVLGDGTRVWITTFGNYTMQKDYANRMSFKYRDGTLLITESLFWVNATYTGKPLSLSKLSKADIDVLAANDTIFQFKHPLKSDKADIVGYLTVTYQFTREEKPKISVLYENELLLEWQITWCLLPSKTYLKTSENHAEALSGTETVNFGSDTFLELGDNANPSPKSWRLWSTVTWEDYGQATVYGGLEKVLGGKGITIVFSVNETRIDPSTVATTTEPSDFGGHQRMTYVGDGYSWVFYRNGDNLYFQSSSDGISWGSAIRVNMTLDGFWVGYDACLWYPGSGTTIHLAYCDSSGYPTYTIYYTNGTMSSGDITWSTHHEVVSGDTESPHIAVDSSGYIWVAYVSGSAIRAKQSTNTVGSSWGSEATLHASAGSPASVTLLSFSSNQEMYVILGVADVGLQGRFYNGTGWEENITITASDQWMFCLSAVVDSNDWVHMLKEGESSGGGLPYYLYWNYTADSWSSTGWDYGGSIKLGGLTINKTTDDMYGWASNPGNDTIYYRFYDNDTGSWGDEVWTWNRTDLISNHAVCMQVYYETSGGYAGGFWREGSGSPYDMIHGDLGVIYTAAPTIGEFQAPSTVYANKYFFLNASIEDNDGVAEFVNATIEINGTIILKWVNSTNTFSEQTDTNNYCTLDASGSVRTTVNSTAYKLSWKVKLNWTYPEGSISVIVTNTKVFDSDGTSGSGSQTGLFTFEDDLIIHTDATVDDSCVNPGQSITFTGSIFYQGTSTVPEDVSGIAAYVELSGAEKGSDTNVVAGEYSINFNAESAYEQHSYNVYCLTDQNSLTNQTVNVVVGRLNVTEGGVSDSHCDYGSTETVWFKVYYHYDNVVFNSSYGTVYVNGSVMTWSAGNSRWEKTYSYDASIKYVFKVSSITDTEYGLTTFNDAAGGQDITWNRVVVLINANSTSPDAGQTIESNITATYECSGTTVTSWSLNVLRNETHYATGNFTDSSAGEVTYQYTTENVTENTYGLTAFTSNTLTVIWANLFIEINEITVNDARINITVEATAYYHCRFSANQSSCTTGTLYVNSTSFSINATGWATVTFTFNEVCKKALLVTGVNVNGETDYGQVPADPEIVWDRSEIYYFMVDDSRVDLNDNVEVRVRARLDWDNHAFGSGDTIYVNNTLLTWDSTNNWFDGVWNKATAGNWTFTVTSGNEATYDITTVYCDVSEPTVAWDSLEVYDLELDYLGDGQYQYQAAIRYGYGSTAIDGATLKLLYPDLATETTFTSNSTGWISFVLSQLNATQTGTWTIHGYNDNNYGITYKAQNQTFNIRSLILNSKDDEANSLSGTTIKVYNGTTLAYQPSSTATAYYPETSYTFKVYWLEDLLVNETASYSLTVNSELNLTCLCYPFTLDTIYHVAGNATISSASWNSTTKKMALTFTGAETNYILVSSYTNEPTYVLNCTYDIDTDFGTYLVLTHYANLTITIAYPNWVTTRVHSTEDRITNAYWSGEEKLYIVLTGNTGENGRLEVYCGSRGTPESTSGLTDAVYNSSTTILAGTYTFTSTTTATLDWTTDPGGHGGTTTTTPSIFLTAETIDVGAVQQGTSKTFNASASWTGATSITIADLTFTGEGSEWLKYTATMPYNIQRLAIETTGTVNIPITLTVPSQAKLGNYKVLITYKIKVGTSTYETTANIMWTVTSTPMAPTGVPEIMSILLLISLVGIVVISIKKK